MLLPRFSGPVDDMPVAGWMRTEVVEQAALPEWNAEADPEQLQKMADLVLEYGITDAEFDVEAMVAD